MTTATIIASNLLRPFGNLKVFIPKIFLISLALKYGSYN